MLTRAREDKSLRLRPRARPTKPARRETRRRLIGGERLGKPALGGERRVGGSSAALGDGRLVAGALSRRVVEALSTLDGGRRGRRLVDEALVIATSRIREPAILTCIPLVDCSSTTRVRVDDSLARLWKRRRQREEAVQVSRGDSSPSSKVPRQRETLSTSLDEASSGLVRALLPRRPLARSRGCRPGSRDLSLVTWVSCCVCGDLEEALVPAVLSARSVRPCGTSLTGDQACLSCP